MLMYETTPNFVAARAIGGAHDVEQHILDTITTLAKYDKIITYKSVGNWIRRKYRIKYPDEDICTYLSLYVSVGILRVIN